MDRSQRKTRNKKPARFLDPVPDAPNPTKKRKVEKKIIKNVENEIVAEVEKKTVEKVQKKAVNKVVPKKKKQQSLKVNFSNLTIMEILKFIFYSSIVILAIDNYQQS